MYSIEVKKIIFEIDWDNYKMRLVEDDDYQKIRVFLDETPISNSKEEAILLEEYYKKTIDMIRIRYHYLVLKDQEIIGIIYANNNKKTINACDCQILFCLIWIGSCSFSYMRKHYPYFTEEEIEAYRGCRNYLRFLTRT